MKKMIATMMLSVLALSFGHVCASDAQQMSISILREKVGTAARAAVSTKAALAYGALGVTGVGLAVYGDHGDDHALNSAGSALLVLSAGIFATKGSCLAARGLGKLAVAGKECFDECRGTVVKGLVQYTDVYQQLKQENQTLQDEKTAAERERDARVPAENAIVRLLSNGTEIDVQGVERCFDEHKAEIARQFGLLTRGNVVVGFDGSGRLFRSDIPLDANQEAWVARELLGGRWAPVERVRVLEGEIARLRDINTASTQVAQENRGLRKQIQQLLAAKGTAAAVTDNDIQQLVRCLIVAIRDGKVADINRVLRAGQSDAPKTWQLR